MNDLSENDDFVKGALERVGRRIDRTIARSASRTRWTVSIASFATAGLIAGGLTAGALAGPANDTTSLQAAMATTASGYTYDGPLVGDAVFVQARGPRSVTLPIQPKGANAIVFSIQCLSVGPAVATSSGTTDGSSLLSSSCKHGPAEKAAVHALTPGDKLFTKFALDGDGQYAFWASWFVYPPSSPPSAAQKSAVADGLVTRAEYLAGWQRLTACMSQVGFDLAQPSTDPVEYPAQVSNETQAAFDHDCWPREYKQIDEIWQGETATRATACLQVHGFTPASQASGQTWESMVRQHGLTPEQCGMLH